MKNSHQNNSLYGILFSCLENYFSDDEFYASFFGKDNSSSLISPTISAGIYNLTFVYIIPALAADFTVTIISQNGDYIVLYEEEQRLENWILYNNIIQENCTFQVAFSMINKCYYISYRKFQKSLCLKYTSHFKAVI